MRLVPGFLLAVLAMLAAPAWAQPTATPTAKPTAKKAPASTSPQIDPDASLLAAWEMDYDEAAGIVTARGNVEMVRAKNNLQADEMLFDQKQNLVSAQGNVSITDPDGTVLFANDALLSSDFKDGYANKVGMLMPDDTRFAATDARRAGGAYTIFNKGVFSPCHLCETNPRKAPLWQMRAAKVTHDQENKDLIYRDATLEMAGIPMFYTPYFSHPDPTVKRRSGFLTPSAGRNSDIGGFARIPYYYTFSPDLDYTASPVFSQNDGVRWVGSLRKRFENGATRIDHSFAFADRVDDDGTTKKDQFRGSLSGFAQYNINSIYRAGADFNMQTDKNYLRRYGEGSDDILTNRAYLEGFKGRNYGAMEMFYFQDNRPGPRPEQPLVVPRGTMNLVGEPGLTLGGRWSFDGTLSALSRHDGADTRKLGTGFGWERRDILPFGLTTKLVGDVRNDIFWVNDMDDPRTPGVQFHDDVTNRLFPQGQATVSYPLVAAFSGFSHVLEPTVALTAAPQLKDDPRIPNEDSLDLDFDTTNLFDISRYTGTDAIEQGTRVTYGLRTGLYANQGSYGEFTFGQSYRITPDANFPTASGLDTRFSDYVGQFKFETTRWEIPRIFRFDYQFRLDKDATSFRRHEMRTVVGVPEFTPYIHYTYSDPPPTNNSGIGEVEEMKYGFSSTIADYYIVSAEQVRDLRPATAGVRTTSAAIGYRDECFTASITWTRDYTERTGVNSGDSILFRLYFKHLGGIDSGEQ